MFQTAKTKRASKRLEVRKGRLEVKKGGLEVRKGGLKVREGRMEARKGQKAVRKRGRGVKTTRKEKRLLLPPKRVTTIHLQSISSEGVNNLCPLFVLGRKTLLC